MSNTGDGSSVYHPPPDANIETASGHTFARMTCLLIVHQKLSINTSPDGDNLTVSDSRTKVVFLIYTGLSIANLI